MRPNAYERLKQSAADYRRHRQSVVESKFTAADLSWEYGWYPVNQDPDTAYKAGFQRGCHWAFVTACSGNPVNTRWDLADSTSAGSGEQDGWNAAAEALQ